MCLGIPGQVDRAARSPRAPGARRRDRRGPDHQHRSARGRARSRPVTGCSSTSASRCRRSTRRRRALGARRRSQLLGAGVHRRARRARSVEDHAPTTGAVRDDALRRRVPRSRGRARARRRASPSSPATTTSSSWRCAAATRTRSTGTASSTSCPSTVELVHGPGCPVCVIPMGRVDDAIAVAETPGVIFTSFGDMMRVPGEQRQPARGEGARRRRSLRVLAARRAAHRGRDARPRRRVLRGRLRDDRAVDRAHAAAGPRAGRHQLQRVLQPRHDRPADQGDPRVARPAPRRLPRPRSRVDRRRATARTASCPTQYGKPLVTAGFEPLDILQAIDDAARADPRGPLRGREPVHAGRPRRRQPARARGAGRGVRAAAALRVARPRASSRRAR